VSNKPTDSVGTASGPEALPNFPDPAKTYAKAWRAKSERTPQVNSGAFDSGL
jgi:hypothetical protein